MCKCPHLAEGNDIAQSLSSSLFSTFEDVELCSVLIHEIETLYISDKAISP